MADRYPIVVINGELKELPSGDTIPAAVVPNTFLGLTDTPSAYTSQALKAVRVNAGESALEFYTPSSGITIGSTAITSGTNDCILYQSGGVVSQSANFTFDGANTLTIGNCPIKSPSTSTIYIGPSAGAGHSSASSTFGIGPNALSLGTLTCSDVVAIGPYAGAAVTSGVALTIIGADAGRSVQSAFYCTYIGNNAGYYQLGNGQLFIGVAAGLGTGGASGASNVGLGNSALRTITGGSNNVAVGSNAAWSLTSGGNNVIIGTAAAENCGSAMTGCVLLGHYAGYNNTRDNTLYIANSNTSTPLIYGEFDTPLLRIHGNLYARRTSGAQITAEYDGSNKAELTVDSSGNLTVNVSGSKVVFSDAVEIGGSLTLSAQNIVTDTSTGMKIGTGTTQKLGFFNATPVTQRANIGQLTDLTGGTIVTTLQDCDSGGIADVSTVNDNFAGLVSKVNKLEQALKDLGFSA